MQNFTQILAIEEESIWVEANTSWSQLLDVTLAYYRAPSVLPYNCNLSVAGVLSAGGVGASSFKYGTTTAYVLALEVIDGTGTTHLVTKDSSLFHACLSGQGQFGVMTKACIKLKKVKPLVKTFFLVYLDAKEWLEDAEKIKNEVHYMELFCSPSLQGAHLEKGRRIPVAQWLYALHLSLEYEYPETPPDFASLAKKIKPWKLLSSLEEDISSYMRRHNIRFDTMRKLGQWSLWHPWYECFIGGPQ